MSNDFLKKLETIEDLPAMPQTAKKVMDILNKPDFSFAELVSVISKDMNITASILKLANSALYAPKNEIKNLTQAVSFLGANNIKNLVIAISTKTLFENFKMSLLIQKTWEHSVAVAIYSRIIALKINRQISEETFLVGMLHDIGAIIMHQYLENYENIISNIYGSDESLYDTEKEAFGFTHSEVGAKLIEIWNLPEMYQDVILNHHDCSNAKQNSLCNIVAYADNKIAEKGIAITNYVDNEKVQSIENEMKITDDIKAEIEEMFEEVYNTEKELFQLK